jgi:hypothetical protein
MFFSGSVLIGDANLIFAAHWTFGAKKADFSRLMQGKRQE